MKRADPAEIDRLAVAAREAWFDDGKSGEATPWDRCCEATREDWRRVARRMIAEIAPEKAAPDPRVRAELEQIMAGAPED